MIMMKLQLPFNNKLRKQDFSINIEKYSKFLMNSLLILLECNKCMIPLPVVRLKVSPS